MSEPTLAVLLGSLLDIGDFISTDNFHTVEAVIDDIPRVEKWEAIAQNGYSGRLTFNPKTGKEPTITFHVNAVNKSKGRGGPLAYIVRATVGSLTTDSHVFEQNALFRLRQEYVDLKQRKVPLDEDFDQEAAAYPKLADPGDTHNFHDNWRILEETNVRARDLKNAVSNFTFSFTSGYRCPVKNRAKGFSIESQHIYGTAFDFDVFIYSDEKNTEYLYKLWEILYLSDDRPTRFRLYDQDGEEVDQDLLPTYPLMPSGVTAYTKGHADWR